jgi:hypothetical protein
VFRQWFQAFSSEIPKAFPTELFLAVLELVMTRNVFSFDDTFWLQIAGTAMGTSCACMYATMYYALHERQSILPLYGVQLLYFKRFIDDIIGIWIGGDSPAWTQFQSGLSFGLLCWETSKLSSSAVFFGSGNLNRLGQSMPDNADISETNELVPVHPTYVSASTRRAEKYCLWQSAAILETEHTSQ